MNLRQSLGSIALGLSLILTASCQSTSPRGTSTMPLDGAWEMVSARYTAANGTVSEFSSNELRALKTIGNSRFTFITVRADGSFVRAGGGSCAIAGSTYTERVDYASVESMRGKTYVFDWKLVGDTWSHSGMTQGTKFEEVWRRAH